MGRANDALATSVLEMEGNEGLGELAQVSYSVTDKHDFYKNHILRLI